MYRQKTKTGHPPICDLVPGFALYEGMGGRLAETLVDVFEAVADLGGRFRT